jgi:hypothetical protein
MPARPDPPVESDEEQDEDVEVRETILDRVWQTSHEHAEAAATQPHSFCPSSRKCLVAAAAHAATAAFCSPTVHAGFC